MVANGGFSRNARMNRSGFITAIHRRLIWRNSVISCFENISEEGLRMKMSFGLIDN
jgi:hypothetical protein